MANYGKTILAMSGGYNHDINRKLKFNKFLISD